MDFQLNEDQRAFQDAARSFSEDVFAPNAAEFAERANDRLRTLFVGRGKARLGRGSFAPDSVA